MAYPAVDQLATNEFQRCDLTCGQRVTIERRSLAIPEAEDDNDIRQKYRPFIQGGTQDDWVSTLELTGVLDMAENDLRTTNKRLKVLVLYGSLRRRSYSRLVALEACRILFRLGCDVRVFDPEGLPVKNDTDHTHPKVQELRELSTWSDGQVWVSPEQHGNLVSFAYPLFVPNWGEYYLHVIRELDRRF
jgi:arsenic resistance protein ArsH